MFKGITILPHLLDERTKITNNQKDCDHNIPDPNNRYSNAHEIKCVKIPTGREFTPEKSSPN